MTIDISHSLLFKEISYSIRRFYIDHFLDRHASAISKASLVLDIGGKRLNRRGTANVPEAHTIYLNIDPKAGPDVLASADNTPFEANSFEAILLCEVLEHVADPKAVLKEAHRLLRPTGRIYITVPFIYPLHPDPLDYGRYSPDYWRNAAQEVGLNVVSIEHQGGLCSTVTNLLRISASQILERQGGVIKASIAILLSFLTALITLAEFKFNSSPEYRPATTTGFGIVLRKTQDS